MHRPFSLWIVTANALAEGDVVYLTADDRWSRDLGVEQAQLGVGFVLDQLGLAQVAPGAVGAVLAEARRGEHGPEPVHLRDVLRASGPSSRPQTQPEGLENA